MSNYLILDIESVARPEAEIRQLVPAFNPDKVPLGNATKPDTVAAIIEKARLTHGDDIVAKAALYPEYGQVAIAGFKCGANEPTIALGDNGIKERELLIDAWNEIEGFAEHVITGFNIKGFDLPFMVKRSWILGVKVPRRIYNPLKPKYPWHENIVDLLDVYRCGEWQGKTGGLNQVCRVLGIEPNPGDGKDFGKLWATDKKAALLYNAGDLRVSALVAERLIG